MGQLVSLATSDTQKLCLDSLVVNAMRLKEELHVIQAVFSEWLLRKPSNSPTLKLGCLPLRKPGLNVKASKTAWEL